MRLLVDARVTVSDGLGRYTRNLVRQMRREISSGRDLELCLLSRDEQLAKEADQYFRDDSPRYTTEELRATTRALALCGAQVVFCADYHAPLPPTPAPIVISIQDIFRITHPSLCYNNEQFALKYGRQALDSLIRVTALLAERLNLPSARSSSADWAVMRWHELYCARLLSWAVSSADVILVPSNVVRHELLNVHEVKCPLLVIPYGIDHLEASDISPDEVARVDQIRTCPPYFLYVGQTRLHKNLDLLVRAFREFTWQTNAQRLLLVGKDFFVGSELHTEIRQLGLADKVDFLGYVDDEELIRLYRGASALIHLSAHEGFGFTPLEALAQGCPVIASETSILRETLGEHATFVPSDEISFIVEAMKAQVRAECDPTLRAGRKEHAAHLTWKRTAQLSLDACHLAAEQYRRNKEAD